jgi:uncharacterized membrane protein
MEIQKPHPSNTNRPPLSNSERLHAASALALVAVASLGGWAVLDPNFDTNAMRFLLEEKCYGVARARENDCGSSNGAHSCSGKATRDFDPTEWKFVPAGTCRQLGGTLKAAQGAG